MQVPEGYITTSQAQLVTRHYIKDGIDPSSLYNPPTLCWDPSAYILLSIHVLAGNIILFHSITTHASDGMLLMV